MASTPKYSPDRTIFPGGMQCGALFAVSLSHSEITMQSDMPCINFHPDGRIFRSAMFLVLTFFLYSSYFSNCSRTNCGTLNLLKVYRSRRLNNSLLKEFIKEIVLNLKIRYKRM